MVARNEVLTRDDAMQLLEGIDDDDAPIDRSATDIRTDQDKERSNEHIKAYIDQYVSDEKAPPHAVMINGPWGIGKSYYLKSLLETYRDADDQEQFVYVSLAGLKTVEEMDGALTVALYPLLGKDLALVAMTTVSVAMRAFRINPKVRMRDLADKLSAKLYVFDDLERCNAPIETSLGYINRFVEHHECKVVIVGNEKEIADARYKTTKEKLVGRTFDFQPLVSSPLATFISALGETARPVVERHRVVIRSLYEQSKKDNLRVLEQTVLDFGKFIETLTTEQRANDRLVRSAIANFFPMSFEYRTGKLEPEDIDGLCSHSSISALHGNDTANERMKAVKAKYPSESFNDRIMPAEMWVDILARGYVDGPAVRAEIAASAFLLGRASMPTWRRLWSLEDETDANAELVIQDVEAKFARREYVIPGEIMHVFGMRIWMAREALINRTLADTVADGRMYIDDLFKSEAIATPNPDGMALRITGYDGLGIREASTPEYKELNAYYLEQRERFKREKLPAAAADLLRDMQADTQAFIQKITFTSEGNFLYRDVPILSGLVIKDFIKALEELPPIERRRVFAAIHERYEQNALAGRLAAERAWLEELRSELRVMADARKGFAKVRLKNAIEWSLDSVLDPDKAGQ